MHVAIFATITPKSEHRNAVERALRVMVEQTRAESGNLRYDLFVHDVDELTFDLFELYVDQAAVEAHRQSPHYQTYRSATAQWLAAPTQVRLVRPLAIAPFA
ncbi:antibiotic biosynthesis monooxygenase [Pseudomonas sp. NPDC008258]|uniref:putative quinol monooxygenase n=1 Tax=Pseudomonas sp. NPDC008258 TaxID=3364418 RepID=UPI0036ED0963